MSKAAELANLIGNINAGGGGVNRNIIINGAMNVAQRGTSSTGVGASSGFFTCDRWRIASSTSGRATMTQDSSAPEGFSNSVKLACTTADTSIASDELFIFQHRIEGQNLQTLQKGTSSAVPVTVSFYVKGNASATYTVELEDVDNTRYNSQEFPVTTDWVRVSRTFVADTTGTFDDDNANSLRLNFWLHGGSGNSGGTHTDNVWHTTNNQRIGDGASSFLDSTARTFFITGVQLEVGQNPTEFEHEPFERTLAKCKRYFEHCFDHGTFPVEGNNYGLGMTLYNGVTWINDNIRAQIHFLVRKRSDPTMTAFNVTGLGSGTSDNRWRWWNGSAWEETSGATDLGELNNTGCFINVVEGDASAPNAYMVGGGWSADAEL